MSVFLYVISLKNYCDIKSTIQNLSRLSTFIAAIPGKNRRLGCSSAIQFVVGFWGCLREWHFRKFPIQIVSLNEKRSHFWFPCYHETKCSQQDVRPSSALLSYTIHVITKKLWMFQFLCLICLCGASTEINKLVFIFLHYVRLVVFFLEKNRFKNAADVTRFLFTNLISEP